MSVKDKKQLKEDVIKIKVSFLADELQKIIGQKTKIFTLPKGARSGEFFDYLVEQYPKMFEDFGPSYLAFELNKEKPHALTPLKDGDHYKFTVWTEAEIATNDIEARSESKSGYIELPYKPFEIPKWMECVWRRKNCGLDICKFCASLNKHRRKHIARGEDPDSVEAMMEDVGDSFRETFSMLRKDAEILGIDLDNLEDVEEEMPPEPEKFDLWNKAMAWRENISTMHQVALATEEFWLLTEEAEDLFWYANTITAKTYRQLCNRWGLDRGDDYSQFDTNYTKYVLEECFKILSKALKVLADIPSRQQQQLTQAIGELNKLKKAILEI